VSDARDQVALVTGAGGGIGGAVALRLAARGTALCLVGRGLDALESVAEPARATAARVELHATDLTRDDGVRELAAAVEREFGRLDVLVHSAGLIATGKPSEAPVEELDAQYAANVRAPYVLTQVLLPLLRESQGSVVFVNSSAVLRTSVEVAQFTATQHALKALADALREEVNADAVRVLSVFPGRTATSRQERLHKLEGKEYEPAALIQPEDVAAVIVSAIELPRTVEVTDVHMRPFVRPA
jgi:NADP-dependent 3-hydroxy acid dehydrogenase YdfG